MIYQDQTFDSLDSVIMRLITELEIYLIQYGWFNLINNDLIQIRFFVTKENDNFKLVNIYK